MTTSKVCTKCGKDRPLSEYCKHKITRDGLSHWCKDCRTNNGRMWKLARPEHYAQYNAGYYAGHREKILAYSKVHSAQYYRENRARLLEARRLHYVQHKAEVAEYGRRYRRTAKGKEVEQRKSARRRMLELGVDADVRLTASEWCIRIAEYDSRCCWCGKELADDEIAMDHIVALANGGAHIASNVAPSCFLCNSRQGARDWGYPHLCVPRDEEPETESAWL